jgi:hypothetical protein
MIFVSYSHADENWRRRFKKISTPLGRTEGFRFWSDRNLTLGEWEPQIERAMQGAVAAVLLVSDSYVASDYIVRKEWPYLLRAHRERKLMILWAYLEPCDLKRNPGRAISRFQAMTLGELEPMSKMTDWRWKETMLRGCDMIDEFLKTLERPSITRDIIGRSFPRIADSVPLLAKPARRQVEVLVYSANKKWWRQPPIKAGDTKTRIFLGDDRTKPGTPFKVVVMTTQEPLTEQTYINLPDHRTKSEEITLVRK